MRRQAKATSADSTSSQPRRPALLAAAVLAGVLACLALVPSALAEQLHRFESSFDGSASPAGSFAGPGQMALDQDDDLLYILDPGNGVLLKYDVSDPANPVPADFSALGSPAIDGATTPQAGLELTADADVAVDNSGSATDGQIYVATGVTGSTGGRVDVFDAAGNYLFQFDADPTGVAVDDSGHVYTTHVFGFGAVGLVEKYDVTASAATRDTSFSVSDAEPTFGASRLAIDSAGTIYVSYSLVGQTGVSKFDTSGTFQRRITTAAVTGVAVDPDDDHLYVDTGDGIVERSAGADEVIDKFGAAQLTASSGVAAGRGSDLVLASDSSSHEVSVYGVVTFPEAATGPAIGVSQTAATLTGTANPDGVAVTECEFRWGADRHLTEPPIPCDRDPGASAGPVAVSAQLSGLVAGTRYHYRLHVANANGEVNGVQRAFIAGGCPNPRTVLSSALPGCRAYEKVSPNDKDGADIIVGETFAARDGGAVTYASWAAFADQQGAGVNSVFHSQRSPGAWKSQGINPPTAPSAGLAGVPFAAFSADAASAIVQVKSARGVGAEPYTWSVLRRNPDGSFDQLSPGQPPPPPPIFPGFPSVGPFPGYGGGADDLSLVAYTLGSKALPVTSGPAGVDDKSNLYAATGNQLRLVSVLPDGTAAPDGARMGGYNMVSDDGSRIVWMSLPFGQSEVYVRIDGADTAWASESQRTIPDSAGPQRKIAQYATPDGDFVYFSSGEKLTDDANATPATPDLYRYEVASGELVDLTTADVNGGGADGVLGVSDDGDRVYFAASGNLTPDATGSDTKIYLRDGGATTLVADLAPGFSSPDRANWSSRGMDKSSRVTPDGRYLLFSSERKQTGYDNAGFQQLYLYDAQSGETECVSCDPSGEPATDDAWLSQPLMGAGVRLLNLYQRRNLSADGGKVFFSSADRLVSSDRNGRYDAYVWDGGPELLSTGQSNDGSWFVDASAGGKDAYFLTRQRLVGIDTDNQIDLYDARVGGGIAAQEPRPAEPCRGDACQGPASAPQAHAPAGTAALSDPPPALLKPDCTSLEHKADRRAKKAKKAKKKARKAKKQARRAKRKASKAKRKARSASGKKADRLDKKAKQAKKKKQHKKKKAKKAKKKKKHKKKKAKQAKREARDCKRGQG